MTYAASPVDTRGPGRPNSSVARAAPVGPRGRRALRPGRCPPPDQVPAMPVVAMPLMIWRWKNMNTTISGSAASIAWAMFCAYWMP